MLAAFAAAKDHNVVRALTDRLTNLELVLRDHGSEDDLEKLRGWIRSLFSPHLAELGYDPKPGEPQSDGQRRSLTIHALGSLARDAQVVARSEAFAEREREDPRSVDPNLAGVFVGIAAKVR